MRDEPGDRICFYVGKQGVVADAEVLTSPRREAHGAVLYPDKNLFTFKLQNERVYLDAPVVIDAAARSKLDAFRDRDPGKQWAWFVQSTHGISENDFDILTERRNHRLVREIAKLHVSEEQPLAGESLAADQWPKN
jgi:hypothetical protein